MLIEYYKPIKGFEHRYEISNLGNIKSLSVEIRSEHSPYLTKEKILKPAVNNWGYQYLGLTNRDGKRVTVKIHQLVWDNFGDTLRSKKLLVDHIDGNKLNNCIDNLQLLTHRENITKGLRKIEKQYPVGVRCVKNSYRASIYINGKRKQLGVFKTAEDAGLAYQKALKEVA